MVGSVSGRQEAGEMYELYKSSADSFREYLAGWHYVGSKDRTRDYSFDQIHNICLEKAQREYGRYYSNIDVIDVTYNVKYEPQEDETYNSQVIGSSAEYKKKERELKVYVYSATVIERE